VDRAKESWPPKHLTVSHFFQLKILLIDMKVKDPEGNTFGGS